MKPKNNKYLYISADKERLDLTILRNYIKETGWMDDKTIIVICSPDYSSIGGWILNHTLSHLNNDELFPSLTLEIPYPNSNQVFNVETNEYELFDKYLVNWINKYIFEGYKYLFFDSGILTGRNFTKIKTAIERKNNVEYSFSTLYLQDDAKFIPDYYVERFNKEIQGGLLFSWENVDNPNWDF